MTLLSKDERRLTTVTIADAHPIVRNGLRSLLERETSLHVAHLCTSGGELLDVVGRTPTDIVIVDSAMGVNRDVRSAEGFGLLRKLQTASPASSVVLYTGRTSAAEFKRIEKIGVRAIVSKRDHVDELLQACADVRAGKTYQSATVQAILRSAVDDLHETGHAMPLTSKELDVIRLFAQGLSIRDIAEYLGRAASTISVQKHMAMRKIGISTNSDLFRYARDNGLV